MREFLQGKGIEEFLPASIEESRWSDRVREIERPLFPGYIFARFDLTNDGLVELLKIPGVMHILTSNLTPRVIDEREIRNVRRALEAKTALVPCPYMAGEPVTVASGPLAGVSGVVLRTAAGTRIVVTVEGIRGAMSVEVDAADLENSKKKEKQ